MKTLLTSRSFYVVITAVIVVGVILMALGVGRQEEEALITTTVESGSVRQLVSVSGIAEAEQTAELAFPTSGIVSAVNVSQGDVVTQGTILVSLSADALLADRADALATLARAVATRDELLAGPQTEARAATAESVTLKNTSLETIQATQADLVANARRTLLSSGLTAASDDPEEESVAPVISGTYTCDQEGTYVMDMYSSGSNSGYSFRLSGLGTGTFNASIEQPTSFGDCGLRALFDDNSRYSNAVWEIEIPNKQSPLYVTNRNAYALAQTQAESAIEVATQDLAQTQANAISTNAPARSEAIARANADIASANARIARIDSQIADRILRAPFAGTITEIDILPGETVNTAPIVTLLAESDFEVTARIPEIDIGKLQLGQPVEMVFDTRTDVALNGTIDFISLKATEIDGVAYYEAVVGLPDVPTWMRSGLNADINIIINEARDSLRVANRFITESDGIYTVIRKTGEQTATTTIDITLEGNDGYTAITGVKAGDILVAPE
jgi:HlyD family secretion protein